MEMILGIATILGGISAIWFFWDKCHRRSVAEKEINSKLTHNPTFLKVLEEINKRCENDRAFTIRQVPVYEEPKLIRHERLLLSKQEHSNVKEIEKSLSKEKQPNDPCAAITEHRVSAKLETVQKPQISQKGYDQISPVDVKLIL